MDRSACRKGLGLEMVVVLVAALALAGCSGSTTTSASLADNPNPPENPPPVESPPEQEPPEEPPATGQPSVSLSATNDVVGPGDSVALTWSSQNATSCSASGGWNGSRATQGTVSVGPLTQGTTFSLSCSGPGGNAMAMLSVSVLGSVALEWLAPTENVDGSPVDDLDGFRIYYGAMSGDYTDQVAVADASRTQHQMDLPSGSYYFAMTALDADGNESGISNEVVKTVN